MSKKYTCRIWAVNGSIPRALFAERWEWSGTVTFSSMLSEPRTSWRSSRSSSLISFARGTWTSLCRFAAREPYAVGRRPVRWALS